LGLKDLFKEFLEENKPENQQQDSSKTFKKKKGKQDVLLVMTILLFARWLQR